MNEKMETPKGDLIFFQNKFQAAADLFHKALPANPGMEVSVGIYAESIFLKIHKKSWTNPPENQQKQRPIIFFSVWINQKSIREGKIYYNIHAFKLRQLKGYRITSRLFAENFRKMFSPFKNQWPYVSTHFGPQTLMQGWKNIEPDQMDKEVLKLSIQFLKIEKLIDENLMHFKRIQI